MLHSSIIIPLLLTQHETPVLVIVIITFFFFYSQEAVLAAKPSMVLSARVTVDDEAPELIDNIEAQHQSIINYAHRQYRGNE